MNTMIVPALKWIGDAGGLLELVDQRKLPVEFTKLQCTDVDTLFNAIKTLTVRGAPAIGVAAAYGLVIAVQKLHSKTSISDAIDALQKASDFLASSRPTAVNLFWALQRVQEKAERFIAENPKAKLADLQQIVFDEADSICKEDIEMCRKIGENGWKYISDGDGILTHCNAGALATAGQGTALSVIFEAHKNGRKFMVYADETRPLLQGSRLTAWELKQAGVDVTVICDNMAAYLMKQGKINTVITGADRIAANGDTANKIGTYGLSILAKAHNVPFYIAAPSSTFDMNIANGKQILIEQRNGDEVTEFSKVKVAPKDIKVYNPAFDVTDAALISAIVTERGVINRPDKEKIRSYLGK
jgi:methylthioribose-1-phosphate isomerase